MQIDYGVMAPLSRHVLVHFHVFKNGGSTIEAILEREFPGRFATVHGSHASSVLDDHDIAAFLAAHQNVAAVSSHHLRYPLPSIRRTILFDCCFLRHPLDRLQSVYTWLRAQPAESGDPILVLAKAAGPREFMIRLMDESPHFVTNAQTLLIANGGAFTRPPDEMDLSRAKETLRRMAVPGLVEMFDESLVAAEHFPWGAGVFEELLRLNRLDLDLCEYAENEIRRRFALVPNSDERLRQFKTRCSGLVLQVHVA